MPQEQEESEGAPEGRRIKRGILTRAGCGIMLVLSGGLFLLISWLVALAFNVLTIGVIGFGIIVIAAGVIGILVSPWIDIFYDVEDGGAEREMDQ